MENVFLNASAGSGKTFAICLRYIALLLRGASPNEILTITFTRKAAHEILQRITRNLHLLNAGGHSEFTLALEREYGITQDQICEKIHDVYHGFMISHKRISTIDGFFNSIMKKFSFSSGIRHDYKPSETTKDDEVMSSLLRKSLRDPVSMNLLSQIAKHQGSMRRIGALLSSLLDKSIEFANSDELRHKMSYEYIMSLGSEMMALHNVRDNFDAHMAKTALDIRDIICKVMDIDSIPETAASPKGGPGTDTKVAKGVLELLDKCQHPQELLKTALIKNKGKHKAIDKYIKQAGLEAELGMLCVRLADISTLVELHNMGTQMECMYKLIEPYEKCLREVEDRDISFDSIKRYTFKLMTKGELNSDSNRGFDSEYLYFRLDSNISHILFDEFQDTSIIQYRILLPLIEEVVAGLGAKGQKSIFIVGDDKQSIYGFRSSNPHVFEVARRGLQVRSLKTNYRSQGNIVDFINETFARHFPGYEYQDIGRGELKGKGTVHVRVFESTKRSKQPKGAKASEPDGMKCDSDTNKPAKGHSPQPTTDEGAGEGSTDGRARIYDEVIARIDHILKSGVEAGDIALLVNKRKHAHEIIARACHIAFNMDRSAPLIEMHHVQIIIYYIKAHNALKRGHMSRIQPTTDEGASAHSMHASPEAASKDNTKRGHTATHDNPDSRWGASIHQKRLNKLLGKRYDDDERVNLPETELACQIHHIIEKYRLFSNDAMTFLSSALEHRRIQDIDELIEVVKDKHGSTFKDNAVNALTVHASKGLEFTHVIYVDLDERDKPKDKPLYYYDDIVLVNAFIRNRKLEELPQYKMAKEREEANDEREKLNRLYVAFTRATHGLHIFCEEGSYAQAKLELTDSIEPLCEGEILGGVGVESSHTPQGAQSDDRASSISADSSVPAHKPCIISNIQYHKQAQEEFLSKKQESLTMTTTLDMFEKRVRGNALHMAIELGVGYGVRNAAQIVYSRYGFYGIKEHEVRDKIELFCDTICALLKDSNVTSNSARGGGDTILDLSEAGSGGANSKLWGALADSSVRAEVSFLQGRTIQRVDMIIRFEDTFYLIELKSSTDKSELLRGMHKAQIQGYLQSIKSASSKEDRIRAFVVYLDGSTIELKD